MANHCAILFFVAIIFCLGHSPSFSPPPPLLLGEETSSRRHPIITATVTTRLLAHFYCFLYPPFLPRRPALWVLLAITT
jgi:hypothetical protein